MKALQIGAGLVGRIIAADLSRDFETTVVDFDPKNLEEARKLAPKARVVQGSCTDEAVLAPLLEEADVVTAGVPGRLGYGLMERVIRAGKPYSDISFMAEDFEALDGLAREAGCAVVPDMGVAPGMSNFLVGRGAALLDEVEEAVIYVGGIPERKVPPFNYQVTWSPEDVIEEYTRPARCVRDGAVREVEAMGELNQREFPRVGVLETFITDGLRSLVKNVKARTMEERTLRWPGHVEQIRLLRDMGLFDTEPRNLGGASVVPRKVACDLLFPLWKMDPDAGDRDLTVMQVEVTGFRGRDRVTHRWDLFDRYDEATGMYSMGRCTGSSCAIFARALAQGRISRPGVHAPEVLAGDDALYDFVLEQQSARGLRYVESTRVVRDVR